MEESIYRRGKMAVSHAHTEAWTNQLQNNTGWRQAISSIEWNTDELTTFYQFGVYTGGSIVTVLDAFKNVGKKIDMVYGFDSFEGLPKRTDKERQETIEKGENYSWRSGDFNSNEFYDVGDSKEFLQAIFDEYLDVEVKLIKGWFEDTLNHDAVEKHDLKPAAYVDVDVDTYESSVEVLDFIFSKGIAVPGTVIGFDDWGGTPNWEQKGDGVSKACMETVEKYKLKLQLFIKAGTEYPHVHIVCCVR